jgi:hypothetical protein
VALGVHTSSVNEAVTVLFADIVTEQLVALDESQPVQPAKVEFAAAVAVSVTGVPDA